MVQFILRRLLLLVPVLIGLTIIMFAIARLLPGDPVGLAAGPNATPAEVQALAREFGLDRPVWEQYLHYVGGLAHGDLGTSLSTRRPVAEDIAAYLPATLELVLAALTLAIVIGIPLGLVTAVWRNRWPDYLSQVAAIGAISMPRFFLGLLLQLCLAMWLMWLPLGGRLPIILDPPPTVTGFYTIDALLSGDWETFVIVLKHLAMPAVAMSLSPLATIMRMMRASTIEVMGQDYVTTARALGLPRGKIIRKYVARNAVSATLTVIGLYFGWLLGGTVLVETVFDWPGLGLYATKAILAQDMMPVIAVALVIGLLFIIANLVIDLAYGVINPKVRYS
ncbi:peptide ABC transporter [Haematobacter missouriensis]|uniref:ABC transporter permease n=1 Tax=Haematobacter missouriensis TaxID=366616 RepID=A0A212ANE7_9RHOB|nr:ABC transporter permease [Haematobacter missouriensis]KFI25086.1 peptide ABC transporter [Haematobacter missouriensis]OWJ73844.1 ABC transporter permease [Haematobacter missouriensis]OWJ83021.1 ABC transporter permease [Haematobacter missouriensis]